PNAGIDENTQSRVRSALYSYDESHSSLPIKSSRRFWRRRAMNSCSAFVTAAFFVRSPLTSSACSINSGSIDRFVAISLKPLDVLCLYVCISTHNPTQTSVVMQPAEIVRFDMRGAWHS